MRYVFIVGLVSLGINVVFIIYRFIKDVKAKNKILNSEGGVRKKYGVLIEHLLNWNPKFNIVKVMVDEVLLGYRFVGNGYLYFHIFHTFHEVVVRYESKDNVDGIIELIWKFDEHEDQTQIFKKVRSELTIHNLMLSGKSRQEAIIIIKEHDPEYK